MRIADWHGRAGRFAVASREYETLVREHRQAFGDDDLTTLRVRYQHLHWLFATADSVEAQRPGLEALLADVIRVVGERDRLAFYCRAELLNLRLLTGEDVEQEMRRLIGDAEDALGDDDAVPLTLRASLLPPRGTLEMTAPFRDCAVSSPWPTPGWGRRTRLPG